MLAVFDRMIWHSDRMLLDGLVFRLQHYKSDDWTGGDHFMFYKTKSLVDEYQNYFRKHQEFLPRDVMELGMWDGGSIAFWHELFRPHKHIGVDLMNRSDSPYFRQYVAAGGLSDRIKTFWGTNQADKKRLRELVETELDGRLDLVIDDASHLYAPTLASFETLFPLLPPGAKYIIEDWAWGHWPEFIQPSHAWARQVPLTNLVVQLVEALGTSNQLVSKLDVYKLFVVIERGPRALDDGMLFRLEDHIIRRPEPRLTTRISMLKAKILNRMRHPLQ
jgi:hypothetical protein